MAPARMFCICGLICINNNRTAESAAAMLCYAMLRHEHAQHIICCVCLFLFYVTLHTLQFQALDHTAWDYDLLFLYSTLAKLLHILLFAQTERDSANCINMLGVKKSTIPVMDGLILPHT